MPQDDERDTEDANGSAETDEHYINQRDTIAHWGGYLVRVLETLKGFRAKYGTWPTKLFLPTEALTALREHHLTGRGFAALQSKLCLVAGDDYRLAAQDETGKGFDYGLENWNGVKPDAYADVWLGLCTYHIMNEEEARQSKWEHQQFHGGEAGEVLIKKLGSDKWVKMKDLPDVPDTQAVDVAADLHSPLPKPSVD